MSEDGGSGAHIARYIDTRGQSPTRGDGAYLQGAEVYTASIGGWDPGQISQQANPRGLEEEGGVHNARRTGLEEAGSFQEQLVEAW